MITTAPKMFQRGTQVLVEPSRGPQSNGGMRTLFKCLIFGTVAFTLGVPTLIALLIFIFNHQTDPVYVSVSPANKGKVTFEGQKGWFSAGMNMSVQDYNSPSQRGIFPDWTGAHDGLIEDVTPARAVWSKDGTILAIQEPEKYEKWDLAYDFRLHKWVKKPKVIEVLLRKRGGVGQTILSDQIQFSDMAQTSWTWEKHS